MKILYLFYGLFFLVSTSCAQVPADRPFVLNPEFDAKISNTISFEVPIIGPAHLKEIQSDVAILDTREKEEYNVSHIPNARFIGYNNFDVSTIQDIPKNKKIVLYCSIGYRSEKIGEKLQELGYKNVFNLYGSIFEWVNQGYEIVDNNGEPTKLLHTYNKNWSKWVDEKKAQKIW